MRSRPDIPSRTTRLRAPSSVRTICFPRLRISVMSEPRQAFSNSRVDPCMRTHRRLLARTRAILLPRTSSRNCRAIVSASGSSGISGHILAGRPMCQHLRRPEYRCSAAGGQSPRHQKSQGSTSRARRRCSPVIEENSNPGAASRLLSPQIRRGCLNGTTGISQ
jgi:hypothetical protein